MVKMSIDQKLRLRNFDARHGKIETGAEKGYQWKEKRPLFEGRPVQFPAWE